MSIPTLDDLERVPLEWKPAFRIIPSRFPPIALFEEVADPADLEAVFQIEALTNERLRAEVGQLSLVPAHERISGPGTGYVMAAFTHVPPAGARFNDGSFGAFYAARERLTAIRETTYHRERFLRDSAAPPMELEMRVLRAHVRATVHELRAQRERWPSVYDPADYGASQSLARALHAAGSEGIAYDSVRHEGGECIAVFRPRLLLRCTPAEHLGYVWNGAAIGLIYEKRILKG